MLERSQASFPHRQRWTRTVSAACQSLCSAYSWLKPAGYTDGFSQTPDRCSALAAGCQTGQLETKSTHKHIHTVLFKIFWALQMFMFLSNMEASNCLTQFASNCPTQLRIKSDNS